MIEHSSADTSTTGLVRSWAERNGFADWAIALIWLIVSWGLFQLIAGVVAVGLMFLTGEFQAATNVEELLRSRLDLLFIGNSTGQVLILALASAAMSRLHLTGEGSLRFLRMGWSDNTPLFLALGGALIIVVQPAVIYLGYLNSLMPSPEWMEQMQVSQYEMIRDFLTSDGILLFGILNVAIVPAICEEIMFRGYLMRAFEKSWGIIAALLISSLLFGLFHVQITNLLPLAVLGLILAIMTWLSGNIWPAVLAHFLNNGAAVVFGSRYPELVFAEMTPERLPSLWLLALSIILTVLIIRLMLYKSNETA
jgi:uncharacterized protein